MEGGIGGGVHAPRRFEEEFNLCIEFWEFLDSAGSKGLGILTFPGEKSMALSHGEGPLIKGTWGSR